MGNDYERWPGVVWPEGRRFAFTVFDDPDSQSLTANQVVYDLLTDLGLRTTIGVWPNPADPDRRSDRGETCGNPRYVRRILQLQEAGFEIGFHNATSHTSTRVETERGLDRFAELFGSDPRTMANHYHSREGIYWEESRLTGFNRTLYELLTLRRPRGRFVGHLKDRPEFWGDLCQRRIRYVRNFVFGDVNTLRACPWMPYHDPRRPYVNYWYAGSDGAQRGQFVRMLCEENQDRLEEQGGCCVMYTHFGLGFEHAGRLDKRFVELLTRLSRRNGWFVPVGRVLDEIRSQRGSYTIKPGQRSQLERRWLWHKVLHGSS